MAMAVDLSSLRPGSLPRSCSREDGTPKREYLTRDDARRAARLFRLKPTQAYRCAYGGHYHIGLAREVRDLGGIVQRVYAVTEPRREVAVEMAKAKARADEDVHRIRTLVRMDPCAGGWKVTLAVETRS